MGGLRDGITGDLGAKRAAEGGKCSRKLRSGSENPNKLRKWNKPRLTNSDTMVIGSISGPDTVGGKVGGKADKGSYQGMKAGGR